MLVKNNTTYLNNGQNIKLRQNKISRTFITRNISINTVRKLNHTFNYKQNYLIQLVNSCKIKHYKRSA